MQSTRAVRKNACLIFFLCSLLAACQNIQQPSVNVEEKIDTEPESSEITAPPELSDSSSESSEIPQQITPTRFTNIWDRIAAGFAMHEHYSRPEVANQLRNYADRQNYFDLVSQRAQPFLYSIVEEVEKRNIPLELALLPMVESTFNPRARSGDNAVGLWQFLASTGASYGLQQDFWYDGRRDPLASTAAALDYLEELYAQFDEDWLLALAAYNTGGANLQRAIRRGGSSLQSTSFWDLPLARETRSHVPRLLALARIVAAPANYGIELPEIPNENPVVEIDIGSQIELAQVATLLDMENDNLQALNPGYLQWATHPEAPQSILVPSGKHEDLRSALADLDPSEFVTWEHYRIQPGDTLSGIARKINTSVALLRTVNRIQGSRIIAGRDLLIPRGMAASDSRLVSMQLPPDHLPVSVPSSYTVRVGDNLWIIARRFDLYSVDIAAWNGFELNELLHPGQVLDFSFINKGAEELVATQGEPSNDSSLYVVRRGDSPAKIASRLGISVQDVLRWNQLSEGEIIYPGQRVRIAPPQGELN